MIEVLFSLGIFVISAYGIVLLEIFLSKAENKRLGLVLPAITLLFSIIAVLGAPPFTISLHIILKKIMNFTQDVRSAKILTAAYVFVLYNIPTVILLAIYSACRKKGDK